MESQQRMNYSTNNKKTLSFEVGKVKVYIIGLILALVAVVQLYPLVWLLLFSLKNNAEIFGGNVLGLPKQWIWSNYSTAITSGKVGVYFLNSVFVTAATIIISGILIASASYGIIRMKWRLSKTTLNIFLLGMMVPIHATLLPLFVILKEMKMLNSYWALIIPYVAFALPMGIFILTGFLHGIPTEMEEAACLDGCNIYQTFYKIILPLLRPAIATISIFTYLSTWNELMFATTFVTKSKLKTLTVGIMSMAGERTTQWGPIGAGLVIATLPTILIYVLLSDQVQKSLTSGAVKG